MAKISTIAAGDGHGQVKKFVELVKNTYRVLLTRGMKGCYVHFMDKETERFFKSRMEIFNPQVGQKTG